MLVKFVKTKPRKDSKSIFRLNLVTRIPINFNLAAFNSEPPGEDQGRTRDRGGFGEISDSQGQMEGFDGQVRL